MRENTVKHPLPTAMFVGSAEAGRDAVDQGCGYFWNANDAFLYEQALREGVDGIRAYARRSV